MKSSAHLTPPARAYLRPMGFVWTWASPEFSYVIWASIKIDKYVYFMCAAVLSFYATRLLISFAANVDDPAIAIGRFALLQPSQSYI